MLPLMDDIREMIAEELVNIVEHGLDRFFEADLVIPDAERALAEILRRLTEQTQNGETT